MTRDEVLRSGGRRGCISKRSKNRLLFNLIVASIIKPTTGISSIDGWSSTYLVPVSVMMSLLWTPLIVGVLWIWFNNTTLLD
ncbi:hypothetical protein BCR33DRAFT_717056 [Rhizoclosmatium globosum]|uniref:Uncharacterized protein n=1 Tax=Rhizoclosmatium globosum TaxID=329046 RepID=A0A1Y2ABP0_9FUNG|nr:hypothetical protein BCR33DRAFT_730688 [Rhizoclosmatium globosum]ORY36536.1 hypothetical protein BCR33DRAFT_722039 [Rhizoclosmatium globosum]ORY44542.1 hypothetical protein BCR33DRAFT_717056 [Rhizoclosmatium globosum]|eukprot:ORY19921.1 hypothetical protein BCR33DRAFT_730688 [Rhizoclosmatium globosum]